MSFTCTECYDTATIDRGGQEITCPYCYVASALTVKVTGLAHGLGESGSKYKTAGHNYTSSTITFVGTRSQILDDVISVRRAAEGVAARMRLTGRNYVTSGPIAIENRVRKILAEIS